MNKYVMTLDAGTTSNRCLIFDEEGKLISLAQKEFKQIFPKPGWVEHDPREIWSTQIGVAIEAFNKINIDFTDIRAIGITNQRETTILWDKYTGEPIYNAICWQCRRTSNYADKLKELGYKDLIKEKTGLEIDAYFSATKIKWILDNVDGAIEKAKNGEILFGTVDTWLLWMLTDKKVHKTDFSNASRTMLFNINTLEWDEELLEIFDIPREILPEVVNSSSDFGFTDKKYFGGEIPITGILGDQQAALFGQACYNMGEAKETFGTGAFILMNTGNRLINSKSGIISTIAWGIDDEITYALEGSIFTAGAIVQWLRDEMRLIDEASDSEYFARKVSDTNGCYLIPAFTGLGAPYWDQEARGIITGLTRGVNKYHIVRAALESIAYLSHDVLKAMEEDSNIDLKSLKVDGGASRNDFLMEYVADILNVSVNRPINVESTALGAGFIAGLKVGFWKDEKELRDILKSDKIFYPHISDEYRANKLEGWNKAIGRSLF